MKTRHRISSLIVGPPLNLVTDQRGFPRATDGNGDGVLVVDIGAYEAHLDASL